jgi:hypothetical protein
VEPIVIRQHILQLHDFVSAQNYVCVQVLLVGLVDELAASEAKDPEDIQADLFHLFPDLAARKAANSPSSKDPGQVPGSFCHPDEALHGPLVPARVTFSFVQFPRKATRMSDTKHREFQEWATEFRSQAAWFLLTLIGSAVAAVIVAWIPYPSLKTVLIGIILCSNALLIAWLSWVRTRDNKATTRELTVLLDRIEKLQKASLARRRQQGEQPRQPISGLENRHRNVVEHQSRLLEPPSQREFEDSTTLSRWDSSEQDAYKQWTRLNNAEKAIVRFVFMRGVATATQLLGFREPGGFRSTDTCAGVKEKSSFLLGDLQSGLTINPQLKPYLEKIVVQDKRRGARF